METTPNEERRGDEDAPQDVPIEGEPPSTEGDDKGEPDEEEHERLRRRDEGDDESS